MVCTECPGWNSVLDCVVRSVFFICRSVSWKGRSGFFHLRENVALGSHTRWKAPCKVRLTLAVLPLCEGENVRFGHRVTCLASEMANRWAISADLARVAPRHRAKKTLDSFLLFYKYRNMEVREIVRALGALAQESRLAVFRLLVEAGPQGVAAGAIGDRLGIPATTLSFHLSQLSRARLVASRRNGRSIIYSADFETMDSLIGYLGENCCKGVPPAYRPAEAADDDAGQALSQRSPSS